MAYDPKNLSLLAQGPRKVWMHVSSEGLAKEADVYFEGEHRLSPGDLIVDISDNTVAAYGQLLIVENISGAGVITVADFSTGNLT